MSENALEASSNIPSRALDVKELKDLIASGLIPKHVQTPERAVAIIRTGQEMGLPMMASFNNIHVIAGKTVVSWTVMGSLLKEAGVEYNFVKDHEVEDSGRIVTEVEMEFISKVTGKPKKLYFAYTWGQATAAGYTKKDNWTRMPKEMLRARCLTGAVRTYFPEVLMKGASGLYTDVEIISEAPNGTYNTTMNDDGTMGFTEVEEVEEIKDVVTEPSTKSSAVKID